MKSNALPHGFPDNPEAWKKLIDAAPENIADAQCPYDPNDPSAVEAYWKNAVVSRSLPELREKLANRRRGPSRSPTKVPTTIRFDADVLAALKASGKGWQTRVNEAVKDWLKTHSAA
ncbi:BrnA antitoxin family protein [Propionivibrio sp.]|uniref:BrnA antitoxin family protein n=1 Tax=Propionivibrio sp. TaxID=2212460 RepID=UPI003BF27D4B